MNSEQQPDVYESSEDKEPNLTFDDLQTHAEAGFVKRAVARYLFSTNPDRSVKMYTALGMPLLRSAIMNTYGKRVPAGPMGNYRMDPNKSMIERSMSFAVGGSAFNEAVHTGVAGLTTFQFIDAVAEGHNAIIAGVSVGMNVALVGLQRYNRARLTLRIDEELANGETLSPEYTNWLGIDGRAIDNIEDSSRAKTIPEHLRLSNLDDAIEI